MINETDIPAPVGAGADALQVPGTIPAGGVPIGTLRINGRAYGVRAYPPALSRVDAGRPVYYLRGARGALYRSMRNVPNPDRLFVYGSGRTCVTLAWLSDAGGALRVIR